MANTVLDTNRTIEVKDIDSDYLMPPETDIESVVLIPGGAGDQVSLVELIGEEITDESPTKVKLVCSDTEPRIWYSMGQRLRLGFVLVDSIFTAGAKVIFNLSEVSR